MNKWTYLVTIWTLALLACLLTSCAGRRSRPMIDLSLFNQNKPLPACMWNGDCGIMVKGSAFRQ